MGVVTSLTAMSDAIITKDALKQALREVLLETVAEQQGAIRALIADVVEDLAFGEAMQEGETTKSVGRERIFDLLDDPS